MNKLMNPSVKVIFYSLSKKKNNKIVNFVAVSVDIKSFTVKKELSRCI